MSDLDRKVEQAVKHLALQEQHKLEDPASICLRRVKMTLAEQT